MSSENFQMMIQASRSKGSLESGSKDEKNAVNNGISGEGLIVCWNKFLPFRSLKVLVVESDDSTRHVISALLNKCGYEVIAVANGLQAWKVLEDRNKHVDVVLTEIMLPYLPGLGLLRKIMSHETHKNLPVIMMSSSDSLGIVFKCLSKGATDFLVKPIRKNELRTLWQHVWRKGQSTSGGSISEIDAVARSKLPVKSSGTGKSGSNSNDGNDNRTKDLNNQSHGLSNRNESDQGSGTQKASKDYWKAKPDPPPAASAGHLSDQPMHNWDLNHSAGDLEGYNAGDETIVSSLTTKVPGNPISKLKPSSEKLPEIKASSCAKTVQEYTSKDNSGKGFFEINEKAVGKEMVSGDPHVAAASTRKGDAHLGEGSDICFLEMSLKRSEGGKGNGGKAARQRNVLGHSSHSAFSRYRSVSKAPKVQSGNEGSCSPPEDGSEGAAKEARPKYQINSPGTTTVQNSEDNRNANEEGLNDTVYEAQGCKYKQPIEPNSVQPAKRTHTPGEHVGTTNTPGEHVGTTNASLGDANLDQPEPHQHIQQPHHYHPYRHHDYHVQNMQQSLKVSSHGDSTMNDIPIMDHQLQPPFTGSVMNSLNRTAGNNVGRGANIFGFNPMEETGVVYGFMNGIAANRQVQRLAAIHKFRQKRKDRCFRKKIQYERRKILADQRPRIKGQFVRRTDSGNNNGVHFC